MEDIATRTTIGILGHVGNQNLGDEAIVAAVIENIRSRRPTDELKAFTSNPADTEVRHGITAFPIRRREAILAAPPSPRQITTVESVFRQLKRRLKAHASLYRLLRAVVDVSYLPWEWLSELAFLVSSYRNVKGTDLLVIAGSQQLNDYIGGPWIYPFTILKWCLLARLARVKVAFLSVGAGPITSGLSRLFLRYALSTACYRSYRDEASHAAVTELHVSGNHVVVSDLAYSLTIPDARPRAASHIPIVGINPLPYFDSAYWHRSEPGVYDSYIEMLAQFAAWLVETNHQVVFFPTQLKVDPAVIHTIQRRMDCYGIAAGQRPTEAIVTSFGDLVQHIRSVDTVVATRYHAILFSFLLNKPVLGLAYHRKSHDLMAAMDQSSYALDASRCDFSGLKTSFLALERRRAEIAAELADRLPSIRRALALQYDELLAILGGTRSATSVSDVVPSESIP